MKNQKNKKIAILIPCYNESKTIAKVIADYKAILPEADIYVYDNNSSDHMDEITRKAGTVVRYEKRQGKGNVIRTMFRDISADCYLMIDGDDTYPAENVREMVEKVLQDRYDMVVGDRLSSTYFTETKPLPAKAGRFSELLKQPKGAHPNSCFPYYLSPNGI